MRHDHDSANGPIGPAHSTAASPAVKIFTSLDHDSANGPIGPAQWAHSTAASPAVQTLKPREDGTTTIFPRQLERLATDKPVVDGQRTREEAEEARVCRLKLAKAKENKRIRDKNARNRHPEATADTPVAMVDTPVATVDTVIELARLAAQMDMLLRQPTPTQQQDLLLMMPLYVAVRCELDLVYAKVLRRIHDGQCFLGQV